MSQAGVLNISGSSLPTNVATSFVTNSGTAVPVAHILNVLGGNNISTSGAGNTLTIGVSGLTNNSFLVGNASGSITSIGPATNGQILIGSTGGAPVLANLTAGTNITITNQPGGIVISSSGGGGGGGINQLSGNSGVAIPSGGNVNVIGGTGISTSGVGSTLTINTSNIPNSSLQNSSITFVAGSNITLNPASPATISLGGSLTISASASGTDTASTPYIVGPSKAGYATISSAITQAVADGASVSNPKVILIQYQSITENVNLPTGIYLQGLGAPIEYGNTQTNPFPRFSVPAMTTIIGTITIDNTSGHARNLIENIAITPTANNHAINLTGNFDLTVLYLNNCWLDATGTGNTINCNGTTKGLFYFKNTIFNDNSPQLAIGAPDSANGTVMGCERCQFVGGLSTTGAGSNAFYWFNQCTFGAQVSFNDSSTCSFNLVDCTFDQFNTSLPSAVVTNAKLYLIRPFFRLTGGALGSPLISVSGTGKIFDLDVSIDNLSAGGTGIQTGLGTSRTPIPTYQGCMIAQRTITTNTTLAYGDYLVLCNKAGALTVTVQTSKYLNDQTMIIKDISGNASVNNITITPTTGTIDGAASKIISTNYGVVRLYFDGTNYFTI